MQDKIWHLRTYLVGFLKIYIFIDNRAVQMLRYLVLESKNIAVIHLIFKKKLRNIYNWNLYQISIKSRSKIIYLLKNHYDNTVLYIVFI